MGVEAHTHDTGPMIAHSRPHFKNGTMRANRGYCITLGAASHA